MYKGPKEVIVKRVSRPGYFGISSYPKSTTTLGAEITKNGFNTGLTADDEKYYEEALGLKPGELSRHSKWWTDVFNVEHGLKLFNTKSTTLVLDNPLNQIKYKVLNASSKVATSEIEKGNPNVEFYIVDEEAKALKESEQFDYEMESYELIFKLSPEKKRQALRLFGKTGVDSLSESMVKAELIKESKKDAKMFISILSNKKLETRLLVEELLDYRILTRKGNYFMNGDDVIANSTDEAVEYFEDLKNQSVVLALQTKLKKLKKDK
jgi:hypothetical protein